MPSLRLDRLVALTATVCALGCPPEVGDTIAVSVTSDPDESGTSSSTTTADADATESTTGATAGSAGSESDSDSSSMTSSSTSSTTETTTGQAVCGDGEVQGDEECDDGNDDDLDACLSSCELAGCGDGIVHDDFGEECDDGNSVEDDGCNSACARDRFVFLTSTETQGKFGAVSGANSHCKSLAQDAGLPNPLTYRAWMSDDTHNPNDWFLQSQGRYLLTNGALVANNWDDLTDGTIESPINVDEKGELVENAAAWTNTTPEGLKHPDSADCEGWTTTAFPTEGRLGQSWKTDGEWTDAQNFNPTLCGGVAHFYCFEN